MTDPTRNGLLDALPETDKCRLRPQLELAPLPARKVLYESNNPIGHVYFPVDCVVSLICSMESGASAEVAVVGNEGVVGIGLFMGGDTTPGQALVQNAGFAYRLAGRVLKLEFDRCAALQHLLLRYTQSLLTQMAQTAACNRHHSVEQQLCRWLPRRPPKLPH